MLKYLDLSIINRSICKTKLYKMIKEQIDWRIKKLSVIERMQYYFITYNYAMNKLFTQLEKEKNDRK